MDSLQRKGKLQRAVNHLRLELAEILRPKEDSYWSPKKVDQELMKEFRTLFYMKGEVDLWLHDPLPKPQSPHDPIPEWLVQDHRFVPNTVVDAGEIWLAELLAHKYKSDDATLSTPLLNGVQSVCVGTGAVATTQNDIDLGTAISNANGGIKTVTTTFVGTGADNKFKASGFYDTTDAYNPGNPNSLTEAALFATSRETVPLTGETQKTNRMFNRTVFAVISKSSSVQLTVNWTIEIGALTA